MTLGRQIALSNDLLVDIVRPEIADLENAAGFLWNASAHLRTAKDPRDYQAKNLPRVQRFVCTRAPGPEDTASASECVTGGPTSWRGWRIGPTRSPA